MLQTDGNFYIIRAARQLPFGAVLASLGFDTSLVDHHGTVAHAPQ